MRHLDLTEEELNNFWSKVGNGIGICWEWKCSCSKQGYGQFFIRRNNITKSFASHRIAYLLCKGNIPDGMVVCHACDNKKCCNPEHLFLGTQKDNVMDMVRKGRHVSNKLRGSKNPKSKVTEQDVVNIRKWYKHGEATKRELAYIFGLHVVSISYILANKTWKYVEA